MVKTLLSALLFLASVSAFGQVNGEYRSNVATGNWNAAGSWQVFTGTWGAAATPPTGAEPLITIRTGHNITMPAGAGPAQPQFSIATQLDIEVGGTLTLALNPSPTNIVKLTLTGTINNFGSITMTLTSLQIAIAVNGGTIFNKGSITSNTQRLKFNANSFYIHGFDVTRGTIPLAAWVPTSTCRIAGYTTNNLPPLGTVYNGTTPLADPSLGTAQTFGTFEWNCPNQANYINLAGAIRTVTGNLNLFDNQFYGVQLNGTNNSYPLTISGNLDCRGTYYINAGSGAATVTIGGSLIVNDPTISGAAYLVLDSLSGTTVVNVNGSIVVDNFGYMDMSFGGNGTTTMSVKGNYTVQNFSAIISGSGTGTYTINFNGTTQQTVTESNSLDGINISIANNAIVSIPDGGGTNFLGTDQSFTLGNNATLRVGSVDPDGAIQNGNLAGNIRVSGARNYTVTPNFSTIEYNGTSAQTIGDGHPSSIGVNTIISNAAGVSIAPGLTGVSIGGDLLISSGSGNLTIGAGKSLTTEGTITANGNSIAVTNTTDLIINSGNGSAITGTFPFVSGARTIRNFTLNRPSGSLTFANGVTVAGVVTLTAGDLIFNGQSLTLNGTFAAGAGNLSSNISSSILTIGGSSGGSFGTLRTSPGNETVGTFTMNRSGGTASVSNLIVSTALNLTGGDLTNSGGLQLSNGGTLTRNSAAQLLGDAPSDLAPGQTYNLTYTGSTMTAGFELPTTVDDMLGNLTINGGTITLDKNIIVRGNVNLQNLTLNAGGHNITLASTSGTWNKTSGSFIGGAGSVIVSGNITITGTAPNFSNLTAQSGSTLTFPAGVINISRNLQLNSGGTFNHNGGTINFTGVSTQTFAGTGKTFNNISVNKTGGNLVLTPSANLLGGLDIQSLTTVQTNGNLTLISTSDGASGNASIGEIPVGASITGDVTVQRRMSSEGRIYRDISSPVVSATVQQIMNSGVTVTGFPGSSFPCPNCLNNASMFTYSEPVAGVRDNGFVGITSASTVLNNGRGYTVYVRGADVGVVTLNLIGVPYQQSLDYNTPLDLVSFTNTGNPTGDGWNFVGNPYASTIDWDNGWTKDHIQGNTISIWDAGANQYKTWNGSIGSLPNGYIATGQGFWFQATAEPDLIVTETSKVNSTGAFYRKAGQPVHSLELILAGPGVEDRTYFQSTGAGSLGFDSMDGTKLAFSGFSLSSLSNDDKHRDLSINVVGEIVREGEVDLIMKNSVQGDYIFSLNAVGDFGSVQVSIEDTYTKTITEVSGGKSYKFTINGRAESAAADRFKLVFGEKQMQEASKLAVFPNPVANILTVNVPNEVAPVGLVIDNMGKSLGHLGWEQDSGNNIWVGTGDVSGLASGLYFVKIETNGGIEIVKFIKK